MEFDGEVEISTDKHQLWSIISDPEVLATCVPGAEHVERLSQTTYRGVINRGVAGIQISLDGEVELIELDEPDYVIAKATAVDNQTNSRMEATAEMSSEAASDTTVLTYHIDIDFAGRLAALGSRIIRRQINSDINAFFDNIRESAEA